MTQPTLVDIEAFRRQFRPAPSARSVREWLRKGRIKGVRLGKRWYVLPGQLLDGTGTLGTAAAGRAARAAQDAQALGL